MLLLSFFGTRACIFFLNLFLARFFHFFASFHWKYWGSSGEMWHEFAPLTFMRVRVLFFYEIYIFLFIFLDIDPRSIVSQGGYYRERDDENDAVFIFYIYFFFLLIKV